MFSCAAKREHVCLTDGVQFCLHPLFWVSSCFMYLLVHVFYVLACWEIILAQQCTVDLKAHTCSLAFCMNWKPRWGGGIVMQLMLHFIVSYLTALKLKTGGEKKQSLCFSDVDLHLILISFTAKSELGPRSKLYAGAYSDVTFILFNFFFPSSSRKSLHLTKCQRDLRWNAGKSPSPPRPKQWDGGGGAPGDLDDLK